MRLNCVWRLIIWIYFFFISCGYFFWLKLEVNLKLEHPRERAPVPYLLARPQRCLIGQQVVVSSRGLDPIRALHRDCYSVLPRQLTTRFSQVRAMAIKGRPRFADFNLMLPEWGAHFAPWVDALGSAYPWLEKSLLETHVGHRWRSETSHWVFPFLQRTRPCLLRRLWYTWPRHNSQEVQVLV